MRSTSRDTDPGVIRSRQQAKVRWLVSNTQPVLQQFLEGLLCTNHVKCCGNYTDTHAGVFPPALPWSAASAQCARGSGKALAHHIIFKETVHTNIADGNNNGLCHGGKRLEKKR